MTKNAGFVSVLRHKIFAGALLAVLAFGAGPALPAPGDWMPNPQPIGSIVIEGDSNGTALILIEGGVPSDYIPPACNSPYNTLDLSTSKGRAMLATALTAYTTGKSVKLALSCIGPRPLVTHLWMF